MTSIQFFRCSTTIKEAIYSYDGYDSFIFIHRNRISPEPEGSSNFCVVQMIIIIIIKGHSLRRACLQPATNTQNSKPRPPTTNAKEN